MIKPFFLVWYQNFRSLEERRAPILPLHIDLEKFRSTWFQRRS